MKNKIIAAILIVALFVPTVIAVINYNQMRGGEANIRNTVSVTVRDTAGSEFVFNRSDGEKSRIEYWLGLITSATKIGTLPTTVENNSFYQVTVSTALSDTGYKFYFTTSAKDCYFVDGSGDAYQLAEADADEFLKSAWSACLYENGTPPVLTMSGVSVSPDTSSWHFKDNTGEFVDADTSFTVVDEKEALELEGGLTMNFSVQPDNLTLKITDAASGDVLFDDVYDNLSALTVTENMSISAIVNAKWYEDAERTYYGEQTYAFSATLTAPAQFYAGSTSPEVGEFICVTGVNIKTPENITFQSTPDIGFTPQFFSDGDSVQALIPFNYDLTAGDYSLSFTYGGASQQINITLKAPSNAFGARTVNMTDAVISTYGTDELRQKCEDTLIEIAKAGDSQRYWEGSFLSGADEASLCRGFGHTVTVAGTATTFRHTGVDYALDQNVEIKAVNSGKVVFSGFLDYSGYTVVIEHGYGLKSWYCHMGSAAVEEGQSVTRGDKVGISGSSGFAIENGVHIGMTVFDVPVSQYPLWDDGTWKGIPMYTPESAN